MEPIKKILIPIVDPAHDRSYIELATALLSPDGKILVLKVVEISEEDSLSVGAETALVYRAAMEDLASQIPDGRVELRALVRVSHRLTEGIAETAREEGCGLILLPWKGYTASEDAFFGNTTDKLLEQPPGNVVVARGLDFSQCKRILLPIRGGPYAEFALDLGSALAISWEAELTVLHCEGRFSSAGFGAFLDKLQYHPQVKRLITVQGDPKAAIIREARDHDMLITGAGHRFEPDGYFLGPTIEHLARTMDKPLVVVKTASPPVREPGRDGARETLRPLSQRVDKWFAENTFHRKEFADINRLVELKEKRGLSISLGLPALNEAETVGSVIRKTKERLFDEAPLLDEIVLIDSGSTDDTVRIAEDLGIPVHVHQKILPQYGAYRGKGEALWKSLYVLRGDLIVWIDTDIKNIHHSFVSGVLGPLLREPEIQYVKGFYRRPIKMEGKTYAEGGGRVTELTARPLFNLFFPELSGIIQPLAGEYGGRRDALERVPFFTGYGVETGLLIDLLGEFGSRAIAQVDLGERIHRNQLLVALSQMSFAIIQVFMQRLEEKNMIRLLDEVNRSMKLIKHQRTTYALEVKEIRDYERPPMISIPEYRVKRRELR